jgi:hypothetical protein
LSTFARVTFVINLHLHRLSKIIKEGLYIILMHTQPPISHTHTRAERRAPVWGSEFNTKAAALQGGFSRVFAYAKLKIHASDCLPD